MTDITDLFSTVSRTRVSPQKSYISSYTVTGSAADTGVTLSVANGQYYAVIFSAAFTGSVTLTATLLEGATTKQTITSSGNNSTNYISSSIFQNTSGSTKTVKVQASCTSSTNVVMNSIGLICGSFLVAVNGNAEVVFPINAYITTFEMVGCTVFTGTSTGALNLAQSGTVSTSVIATNINVFVSGINCSANGSNSSGVVETSFVAFDFDGKTLAL